MSKKTKQWIFDECTPIDYETVCEALRPLIGKKKMYLYAQIPAPRLIDRVYYVKERMKKEFQIDGTVIAQAVYRERGYYYMFILVKVKEECLTQVLKFIEKFYFRAFMICSESVDSADYERWRIIREHGTARVRQGFEDAVLENESCVYIIDAAGGKTVFYLE